MYKIMPRICMKLQYIPLNKLRRKLACKILASPWAWKCKSVKFLLYAFKLGQIHDCPTEEKPTTLISTYLYVAIESSL